jgi:protocatechuate 3,4-dioxygenase beta subunit
MRFQVLIRFATINLLLLLLVMVLPALGTAGPAFQCEPTPEDEMGPFYRPDAVVRNSVGTGYLLLGVVKSAQDCSLITTARIELWMTGPDGHYGEQWRATIFSAENGSYHFQSHAATDYGSRRPHIHIRVTADGFNPLVTQHYPVKDAGEGLFNLVLTPSSQP